MLYNNKTQKLYIILHEHYNIFRCANQDFDLTRNHLIMKRVFSCKKEIFLEPKNIHEISYGFCRKKRRKRSWKIKFSAICEYRQRKQLKK